MQTYKKLIDSICCQRIFLEYFSLTIGIQVIQLHSRDLHVISALMIDLFECLPLLNKVNLDSNPKHTT